MLFALLIFMGCSEDKLPSRDLIPELHQRLSDLEQAIKANSRAAIDSLMSVEMLDAGQDSDSLLRFVYGANGDYRFVSLANYEIFFTNELAVIDCYIMDSTGQTDRPLKLRFKRDDDLWLLKRFDAGQHDSASGPQ